MKHNSSINRRHGYTLVEVVVSSLIVGVVLVGSMNVLGGSLRTNRVASSKAEGPNLAHQLMSEILALPYEDPEEPDGIIGQESGESGGSRVDFDDLDDYDGWNKNSPETKDGIPVSGADGWERAVLVKHFDPSTGGAIAADTGVKAITVRVLSPDGDQFQLDALRSRGGSLQQSCAVDTTVVTFFGAQLQIGSMALPAYSTIHLKNHATDN